MVPFLSHPTTVDSYLNDFSDTSASMQTGLVMHGTYALTNHSVPEKLYLFSYLQGN